MNDLTDDLTLEHDVEVIEWEACDAARIDLRRPIPIANKLTLSAAQGRSRSPRRTACMDAWPDRGRFDSHASRHQYGDAPEAPGLAGSWFPPGAGPTLNRLEIAHHVEALQGEGIGRSRGMPWVTVSQGFAD